MYAIDNGFQLINTSDRSTHDFLFTTPTFDTTIGDNPCTVVENNWIEEYGNLVLSNTSNNQFNKVVFNNGTLYANASKSTEFIKAFTYSAYAENNAEFLEILEVCTDYEQDFGISTGVYEVDEYNNADGEGNNGFILTQGSNQLIYLQDLTDFPDGFNEECY